MENNLKEILKQVADGSLSADEAAEKLEQLSGMVSMPYADLDTDRKRRTGAPETIYCPGKTSKQIAEIAKKLSETADNIMATRATPENYEAVKALIPDCTYYEDARIILVNKNIRQETDGYIAVITAGTADIPVAEEAALTAEILGNKVERVYDVGVAGIHRLFARLDVITGADAVIVIAGMEGALASVVGGLVKAPVVAVPTSIGYGANLQGLSALLSMLNSCANGVGVVNIDNGYGAACLASKINHK
ncbi:MAG: nickel pincer cofactor biosynthesis protein LarB [Eubacteriaceae bacterium]|jgi:NCAIR mutase (PurE)-related protein|nr:nickel pincer cofactor biosynthesis protein LarB [Eubacteriaceae bacterium]